MCVKALEDDRSLGIAYTGLTFIKPDGQMGLSSWPGKYNYDEQIRGMNQVPTCCVFRREMWARLGGYNQRYAPGGAGSEDAEFWLRCGAYGYKAKKVTEEGLFVYSWMSGRVSGDKNYREVNWRELHPWTKDGRHPFLSLANPRHATCQPPRPPIRPALDKCDYPVGPNTKRKSQRPGQFGGPTFRDWEASSPGMLAIWEKRPRNRVSYRT